MRLPAFAALVCSGLAAQSVGVFSEFQPLPPFPDAPPPREIISPAVARNGFATFQVQVSAPANTSYFLFCQTNPPSLVEPRLYKLALPDEALEPARSPNFGVIPETGNPRSYLLDIWVPPDAEPGRRVRLELQLKVGDWTVYPMELRIQKAAYPIPAVPGETPVSFAQVLARNRRQDQALEDMLELPEVWFLTAQHIASSWTAHSPFPENHDDEWYLKVRDLLFKRANAR